MCHKWQLFSKKFQTSNGRSKDPEDCVDPQPDLSNQTKARGLLHMEHEYIAHHISRKDLRLEHLLASMQPEKYSEDYSNHSNDSKDG